MNIKPKTMTVIPYEDYELDSQTLKRMKDAYVERKISEYVKNHNSAPSETVIASFYDIPQEYVERQKRVSYSRYCLRGYNSTLTVKPSLIKVPSELSSSFLTVNSSYGGYTLTWVGGKPEWVLSGIEDGHRDADINLAVMSFAENTGYQRMTALDIRSDFGKVKNLKIFQEGSVPGYKGRLHFKVDWTGPEKTVTVSETSDAPQRSNASATRMWIYIGTSGNVGLYETAPDIFEITLNVVTDWGFLVRTSKDDSWPAGTKYGGKTGENLILLTEPFVLDNRDAEALVFGKET